MERQIFDEFFFRIGLESIFILQNLFVNFNKCQFNENSQENKLLHYLV